MGKSFNFASSSSLNVDNNILLAKLAPMSIPILALKYNPVLAIAICDSSTPAAIATKVVASTMPVPKPPGPIKRDSQTLVLPFQKTMSSA